MTALRQAQGGESFDSAQDREPVERLVEAQPRNLFPVEVALLGQSGVPNL